MKYLVRLFAGTLLLATGLGATPPRKVPTRRAGPTDWSQVASRTAEGGFVLGNPAAKVKLVEYLSLTCPHCAVFEAQAVPQVITKYVKPGRVSYEVRIALRDPFDLAAAVLARCDGPKRFFQLKPAIFAAQSQWMEQAQKWSETAPDLSKMPEAEAGRALVKGAGLDAVLAKQGMSPARAMQCMANIPEQKMLSAKAKAIWDMPGFSGTPGFAINGALKTDIHDWAGIDAALTAALR